MSGERPEGPGGPLDFGPDESTPPPRPPASPRRRTLAPSGPRPRGRRGPGWFVGVFALLALAYITYNTVSTDRASSSGPTPGNPLPPFAVPLALGSLDGDANVARQAGQGSAGRRPACEVRGRQILNVCELAERGPVVLAFIATRGGRCERAFDRMEEIRGSFPGVQFAGVAIRGARKDLRALVRRHGWRFPVGYDRDGVLANVYGVAVCPQVTFASAGGIVDSTAIGMGQVSSARLRTRVRDLVATSRARGWEPPAAGRR